MPRSWAARRKRAVRAGRCTAGPGRLLPGLEEEDRRALAVHRAHGRLGVAPGGVVEDVDPRPEPGVGRCQEAVAHVGARGRREASASSAAGQDGDEPFMCAVKPLGRRRSARKLRLARSVSHAPYRRAAASSSLIALLVLGIGGGASPSPTASPLVRLAHSRAARRGSAGARRRGGRGRRGGARRARRRGELGSGAPRRQRRRTGAKRQAAKASAARTTATAAGAVAALIPAARA